MKRIKRTTLTAALLLSLLLHLAWLMSGWLPAFAPESSTQLEPIRIKLTSMQLDTPSLPTTAPAPQPSMRIAALPHPSRKKPATAQHHTASTPVARIDTSAPTIAASTASSALADSTISSATVDETEDNEDRLFPEHALKHFPRTAVLKYQVYYGMLMAGIASIHWQREDTHYTLESRIAPILGPRLRYLSSGTISRRGLRPNDYAAWRNEEAHEHAHFDWEKQTLDYGTDQRQQTPLQPGAQDIFSLIYQLALKGADTKPLQISTGKNVYQYQLIPLGQTDYDTGSGKIRVLVFQANGDDDTTEFWLAPDFANQPVRIIRSDAKMKLDMRVTNIVIDDQNEWHQPTPMPRKHPK